MQTTKRIAPGTDASTRLGVTAETEASEATGAIEALVR
ncbi:hypothetical protein PAMC26510_27495 [Caballeronia sordidicola]|uniref:Uncharacterized protein n=1 Tax=Caballeronia sordidicola TaxID=196367 RepID=A0A242MDD2_CABSO|nr:hypothetical protein PAMC26510_27495 [Caballeronia sordidicola]